MHFNQDFNHFGAVIAKKKKNHLYWETNPEDSHANMGERSKGKWIKLQQEHKIESIWEKWHSNEKTQKREKGRLVEHILL